MLDIILKENRRRYVFITLKQKILIYIYCTLSRNLPSYIHISERWKRFYVLFITQSLYIYFFLNIDFRGFRNKYVIS